MKTIISILNEFFGKKPGQTLAQFQQELKALSAEEKLWLAREAAKALGYQQNQLAFSLS